MWAEVARFFESNQIQWKLIHFFFNILTIILHLIYFNKIKCKKTWKIRKKACIFDLILNSQKISTMCSSVNFPMPLITLLLLVIKVKDFSWLKLVLVNMDFTKQKIFLSLLVLNISFTLATEIETVSAEDKKRKYDI